MSQTCYDCSQIEIFQLFREATMGGRRPERLIRQILSDTGITINGDNPWDIQIKNELFYQRIVDEGSLGLGESYMDGWWDCENLADFFCRIIPSNPETKVGKIWKLLFHVLRGKLSNFNSKERAYEVGKRHYDMGNELYRHMLDKRMVYSCAYWRDAENLDDAQEAKLDLICRKLGLQPGNRILDIGCGWGSLATYAAEKYKAEVVAITVSREQVELGKELCKGLPVEIRLQDYRDVNETFDHIVSVGMFEHVGYKNYRTYMKKVHDCLRDDGLFILHTIGKNQPKTSSDPWFHKHIFPNYWLPARKQISSSLEGLFIVEDWHAFGSFYDLTLTSWFNNFSSNWHKVNSLYDDRFFRMWKYYLLSCTGAFRSGYLDVWQIVLSKKGVPGGYQAVR